MDEPTNESLLPLSPVFRVGVQLEAKMRDVWERIPSDERPPAAALFRDALNRGLEQIAREIEA